MHSLFSIKIIRSLILDTHTLIDCPILFNLRMIIKKLELNQKGGYTSCRENIEALKKVNIYININKNNKIIFACWNNIYISTIIF